MNTPAPIDCACLIHGSAYDWTYVEKLYSMLTRNLTRPVRLHVYTEESRDVPYPFIKHSLDDWKIGGPKKSWWYKIQIFNSRHHQGDLLYFDLDTVITKSIDWIWKLPTTHFWAVRDFKYLWKPHSYTINSSVMWWNTEKFNFVWNSFSNQDLASMLLKYHGDQDYITDAILQTQRKCFDIERVKSWRWQSLDGGFDFKSRSYRTPESGTKLDYNTSILVFHGHPKPGDVDDSIIVNHWQ